MNIFPSTSAGRLGATVVAVTALLATVLAVLLAPPTHAQHVRYVNAAAQGTNDGSSWANAYSSLQDALATATSGDEIWVAAGTYYPDEGAELTEHHRAHSFQLKTGVALYGGFAGTETTREQRDWATNVTTLSGDLQQNDGDDFANTGDNSYQVVFSDGVDRTAVLDGFTVTGGNTDRGGGNIFPTNAGGGLYNTASSPVLTNVMVRGNQADFGGGLYNDDASHPVLTNVTVSGNQASGLGGGLFNNDSHPVLTNVTVRGNQASGLGGGVFNTGNSRPVLMDVMISDNQATFWGGGLYNDDASHPVLTNVMVRGNQADSGGGLYNDDASHPVLTNVTVSGNQAGHEGGGLFNREGSRPTIQNSIFWGNSAPSGAEIVNDDSNPSYTHSLVQGEDLTSVGTGNLDGTDMGNDPLFAAPADASTAPTTGGDYRLLPESVAIDAGDSSLLPADSTDLDGDSDTVEVLPVDRNGNPRVVGDQVDLGAYEYDPAMPIVTWPAPATMTYGTALDDAQLNATANVPGSFRYAPAAGTVLDVGEGQVFQVVFTPNDTVTYTTVTTTVQIDVRVPLTNPVYLPLLRVR